MDQGTFTQKNINTEFITSIIIVDFFSTVLIDKKVNFFHAIEHPVIIVIITNTSQNYSICCFFLMENLTLHMDCKIPMIDLKYPT